MEHNAPPYPPLASYASLYPSAFVNGRRPALLGYGSHNRSAAERALALVTGKLRWPRS